MLIHLKVITEAKQDIVQKKNETSYIVKTKEPAQENRANKKVIQLIAEELGVPTFKIKIITGHHQPSKIIEVLGL